MRCRLVVVMSLVACHSSTPARSTDAPAASTDAPVWSMARTCDTTQDFGAPTTVQQLVAGSIAMTGDEQIMLYAANGAVFEATRSGMTGAFSAGTKLDPFGAA